MSNSVLFLTHTAAVGGSEVSMSRFLERTSLPSVHVASLERGGIWRKLPPQVHLHEYDGSPSNPAKVMTWLRAVTSSVSPALIVANTMRIAPLAAVALPRRIPFVFWVHDGLGATSAMSKNALRITRAVTLRRANFYITNSDWTDESLKEIKPHAESVIVYPICGVKAPDAATEVRRLPEGRVRLLYLGRLSDWKAPHVAAQALDVLRSSSRATYELSIAGDAQFSRDIEYRQRLTNDLGGREMDDVHMLGHVSDPEAVIREHDILVHCSIKPEPFGLVLVEAMGEGLPVVATNHGAPASTVKPGYNGELYRPGDAADLARAIESVVADYSKHSRGALESCSRYTDEELVPKLDSALLSWMGSCVSSI